MIKKPSPASAIVLSVFAFLFLWLFVFGINQVSAGNPAGGGAIGIGAIFGFIFLGIGLSKWAAFAKHTKVANGEKRFLRENSINADIVIPFGYRRFIIDQSQKLYYATPGINKIQFKAHPLDNILQVDIQENNQTVMTTSGGTAGALAGGILFGVTGAVIGSTMKKTQAYTAVNTLAVNVITSDMSDALVQINVLDRTISKNAKKAGFQQYAEAAQKIYSTLQSYLMTKSALG